MNDDQVITFVSADVSSYESVSKAFDNAATKVGSVPEYVFCCAGKEGSNIRFKLGSLS